MEKETASVQKRIPPPPPLPPPPPPSALVRARKPAVAVSSVTRDEIDRYWRIKKMIEDDHLLAAQKAVARIRAKSLKEEDYRRFEESLKEMMDGDEIEEKKKEASSSCSSNDNDKELRIGIKDWWTKSKYAYLNQPAVKSMAEINAAKAKAKAKAKPTSTYIPQLALLCRFYPAVHQMHTSSSSSSSSSSFGIF